MAKKKATWDKWAFTAAWVLALFLAVAGAFGFAFTNQNAYFVLVVLGIIVGWLYSAKDVMPLMWLILLFVLLSQFTPILDSGLYIGKIAGSFFELFKVFLGTTGLFVVFKKIYSMLC